MSKVDDLLVKQNLLKDEFESLIREQAKDLVESLETYRDTYSFEKEVEKDLNKVIKVVKENIIG